MFEILIKNYKKTLTLFKIFNLIKLQVAELDLGSKTKLNQRSFNILLDLIKCKNLVLLKFSDSVFEQYELDQIKKILLNEVKFILKT